MKRITLGAGIGTNYGTGTVVNPLVTAVKASASTMTATNKIKWVIGNSTVVAKVGAVFSWPGAGFLIGGINGTVSIGNELKFDESNLYICFGENTIHDDLWLKATLSKV